MADGTGMSEGNESASLSARLQSLQVGLFSTLMMSGGRHSSSPLLEVSGLILQFLQMMSFLFITKASADIWHGAALPLKVLSFAPSPAGWFLTIDRSLYMALFYLTFAWILAFASLLAWSLRLLSLGEIPVMAPLRVLATIGKLSAGVLYIPVLSILLSAFVCSDDFHLWALGGWEGGCWYPSHLANVVASAVLALVFLPLASIFALTHYDSHPLTPNWGGRVHGRGHFLLQLIKLTLVVTLVVLPTSLGSFWAVIAINIAAGGAWIAIFVTFMPMTHHHMNALHLALACTYMFSGISLALGYVERFIDASIVIYVMFATAAGAGAGLAYLIRLRMLHMPLAKMSSPLEVEMRARFMLQHAISELEAKTREFGGRKAISDESLASVEEAGSSSQQKQDQKQQEQETGSQAAEEEQMDVTITDANPLFKDDEGVDDGESDKLCARAPPSGTLDADGRSTAPAPAPVKAKSEESDFDEYLLAASYSAMSIEARVQVVQDLVSKTALAETETLFKSANARFPTSSLLHLFQSRYYHTFKSDKHLNISHLLMAIRLGPPIDVAFLAFQARRMLESSSQSGILSSALHRVSFERHLAEARLNTVRAAQVQVAFWQELADPKPDLSAMHSHASSLARHSILAEQHFKDAFQLHPQSLTALRVFAQYNLTAANNPERAAAISAEADRIEDQTNKELMNGKNGAGRFQFYADVPNEGFSDSVAKITIGATSRDLGIILSANSAACKMFGYTRLQLERRNVNVIVPAPFSQAHDYFLRRYTSTGEGTVIETGRILLARHRSGHLVPYSMLVRDGLLPDGTLVFTASLRPVATNQTNIVMLDEAFNIYGGTQGALAQLAIETATLTESDVCMADFCPLLGDPEAVADLMAKAEGNVTPLRLPAAAPELAAVASVDDFDTQVPSFRKTLMSSKLDVVDAKVTLARTCVSDVVVFVMTWRSLTLAEANAQRTISSRRRPSRKEDGGEDTFSRSVSFHQDASGGATGRLSDVDSSMDGFHSGRHTREGEESGDDGSVSSLPPGHANLTAAALAGQGCPFPAGQRAMAARAAGGDVPLPVAEDRGERKKPKSGDGESSVGSESRRSSKGGIGRATFSKLRRILSDHRSGNVTKAVPGLFALYITGWALAILNLALASLSASLLDGNFATYFSNLEFSSIADDAVRAQVHAARLVMRRNLHNRGWLEQSADEIAATTADMSATADLYLSRTMDMYNLVIGTSFEPFFTALDCSVIDFTDVLPQPAGTVTDAAMTAMLEGETYWPLSTMDGSVLVGRRHATNFLDYSARWAGMLKQLSALPAANCTDQHPWSQFITVNTQLGSPAQIKVSRTTFAAYTASRNSRGTVTLATQWIFIAMGPVLSFIILCVVVPIILFVDRSRDDVMERFLDLPALIVSSLRTTAEKRLRSLRTDDEDAESDGEAEDDEELKKMTENIDYDDEDGGGTDWEALFQRAAVEASRAQRSETQHLNVQVGTEAAMPSGLLHTTTGPRAATSGRFTSSALCCARRGANDYPTWCSRGKRAPGGGYYRSVANPDGSVVNFVRRDHRKNSRSLWQLGAVFLMPIALMFVFYLVLFIVTMDTLNSVLNMSSFMIIASMRATAIETGHGSLFSMISQAGYPAENAFRHELTTRELVNLRSLNQFLAYGNELTLLPSVDYGLASDIDMASFEDPVGTETSVVPNLPDMSIITTAMLLNACPFVAPTDPDCTTFDGGVLTSGLQSAIMDYIVRNRRLRERSRFSTVPVTSTTGEGTTTMSASMEWATNPASAGGSAVAGPYSIPGVFKSADWLTLDELTIKYLDPALQLITTRYFTAAETMVRSYRTFLTTFVAAFLVAFVGGIVGIFLPNIGRLGRDIQSKRAMLLLLPLPVIREVPSIRVLAVQIVSANEGNGSAPTARHIAGHAVKETRSKVAVPSSEGGASGPGE